jgi:hypothetical protein
MLQASTNPGQRVTSASVSFLGVPASDDDDAGKVRLARGFPGTSGARQPQQQNAPPPPPAPPGPSLPVWGCLVGSVGAVLDEVSRFPAAVASIDVAEMLSLCCCELWVPAAT